MGYSLLINVVIIYEAFVDCSVASLIWHVRKLRGALFPHPEHIIDCLFDFCMIFQLHFEFCYSFHFLYYFEHLEHFLECLLE